MAAMTIKRVDPQRAAANAFYKWRHQTRKQQGVKVYDTLIFTFKNRRYKETQEKQKGQKGKEGEERQKGEERKEKQEREEKESKNR